MDRARQDPPRYCAIGWSEAGGGRDSTGTRVPASWVTSFASCSTGRLGPICSITASRSIQAIVDGINSGKGLPHGATTIAWPDTAGVRHNFAAADFLNFAAAVRDYVFDLLGTESALAQGLAASWPAQPSPIP